MLTKQDKIWLGRLAVIVIGSIVWALGSKGELTRWTDGGEIKFKAKLNEMVQE